MRKKWSKRLEPLRSGSFRRLLVGYGTQLIGSQMAPVAITFALLDSGRAVGQVGEVLALQTLLIVLSVLLGGALADRLNRAILMVLGSLAGGVSQLVLGGLVLLGHAALWEFIILLGVSGIGQAFFGPAMYGMIPEVAEAQSLQQANALVGLTASIGTIGGPALAGIVVAAASPGWAIVASGICYMASTCCLRALRGGTRAAQDAPLLAQMRQGWIEFRSRPWLWSVTAYNSLSSMLVFAPFMIIGAVISRRDLGGAGAWAAILAAQGVGAALGGLVSLALQPRRSLVAAICGRLTMLALLLLLVVRAAVPLIVLGALASGMGAEVFDTLWDTTVQRRVPQSALSRVNSYDWFGTIALYPLGYAIVGPMAIVLGATGVLWVAACTLILTSAAVLTVPSVRNFGGDASVDVSDPALEH
jgi:hypothetical protein